MSGSSPTPVSPRDPARQDAVISQAVDEERAAHTRTVPTTLAGRRVLGEVLGTS